MHDLTGRSRSRARRTTPTIEGLEGRQLLSGLAPPKPKPVPPSPVSLPPPIVVPPPAADVAPGQ